MKAVTPTQQTSLCRRRGAFTILEVMIAIFIFAIVLTAVYSIWIGIVRGMDAVKTATAAVQRSRIAVRTIEDALLTSEMFLGDIRNYAFVADTSGDMAAISMVSRLPASFPGVGRYGDQVVRRVSFYIRPGSSGGYELMMTQMPLLLDTNSGYEAYTLTLAKDVTMFRFDFYNLQKNEWQEDWKDTNQLPRLVQVALGLGKHKGHSSEPQDVVTRLVSLPSVAVGGDIQGQGPRPGQQPGQPPGQLPGQLPGQPPGQPIFPGGGGIPPGAGGKRGGGIPR